MHHLQHGAAIYKECDMTLIIRLIVISTREIYVFGMDGLPHRPIGGAE